MKLLILFYIIHPVDIDIDHHIKLQTATIEAQEHFAETLEERETITAKREAWEKLLTTINKPIQ